MQIHLSTYPRRYTVSSDPLIIQFIIIIILTLINAFFAGSEMAMISVDKSHFIEEAEDGDLKAQKVLEILSEPSRFLSTIQVGITLAGFFNAALAATGLSDDFGLFLGSLGLPFPQGIGFVLIVLALSFITLVFGELVPKRFALRNPRAFTKASIGIIYFISMVLSPVVRFLSFSTNFILRLLGVDLSDIEEKVSREEIRSLIEVGQEQGIINATEKDMIDSVISFDDQQAEEIMTARTEVFAIDIDDPSEKYINDLLSLKFSRIPVYQDNPDDIIGILYLKDFFAQAFRKQSFHDINIRGLLRPAYFVPERKNISELFEEMQKDQIHMALLIDEYGGFSGLVTMEDLIEEIMGDIEDEYDHDQPDIQQSGPDTYRLNGSISIKEFNSATGAWINEESEDYDTIAGYLITKLDYVPNDGECPTLESDNVRFQILQVEDRRIKTIRAQILSPVSEDSDSLAEA